MEATAASTTSARALGLQGTRRARHSARCHGSLARFGVGELPNRFTPSLWGLPKRRRSNGPSCRECDYAVVLPPARQAGGSQFRDLSLLAVPEANPEANSSSELRDYRLAATLLKVPLR